MGPPSARRRARGAVPHRDPDPAGELADRLISVGHSTLAARDLVALLRGAGIARVADIRRFPASRRLPWFNADALAAALEEAGIGYTHLPALGGRRSRAPGSPNGGWENAGFQGYADWMASAEFATGVAELEALGRARPTAMLCAEAPWWRCHRRLVADALVVRGWAVDHLAPDGRLTRHELTPFAVVAGETITYPPAAPESSSRSSSSSGSR